jgi:hypothetical protein
MINIRIVTLRNALIMSPNIKYMTLNKTSTNTEIFKSIIDIEYYSNKVDINYNEIKDAYIHPKTLCHVIVRTKNNKKTKTYLLLGKDVSIDDVTGYDIMKSGVFDYVNINNENLIKDKAYIFPIMLYVAKIEYPKIKIIYLSN